MTSGSPFREKLDFEMETLIRDLREQVLRLEQELSACRVRISDLEVVCSQQELVSAEHAYRIIIENMSDVVWTLDTETMRFIYVSPSVKRLRGYTPEEVMDVLVDDALMPSDCQTFYKLIAQRADHLIRGLITSNDFFVNEIEQPCNDGTTVWTEASTHYWLNPLTHKVEIHGISRDITERKKTERVHQESEERLRLALMAGNQGWFDLDIRTGEVTISPEYPKFIGYEPEEFHSSLSEWQSNLHPEDRDALLGIFRECLVTGEPKTMEYRRRAKSGDWIWISSVGRVTEWDQNHHAIRMIGTHTCINERKKIENNLRNREEQLRLVLEGAELGFWDWNIVTGEVERNERWAAMLGYSYEEIKHTALQWTDFVHPEERVKAWQSIYDVIEGRSAAHKLEYRMLHKDGSIRWILDQANVMHRDADGKATRMSGTHSDVTERKRATEALRESEERYRLLADTMLQGIVHQDSRGIIIAINPAAQHILGKSEEVFIGSDSFREEHGTIREDGSPFAAIEHPSMVALRTGQKIRGVVMGVFNPRINEYRWINIDAIPVFRPGETYPSEVYTVFEDITERKQVQDAIIENETKYRTLFETANDGIFFQNATSFLDCNEKGANIYGLSKVDIIGLSPSALSPKRQADGRLSSEVAAEKTKKALDGVPQFFEWQSIHSSGRFIDVEITLNRIELMGSIYLQAIMRDITERKRLESISNSFKAIVSSSEDAIVSKSLDGIITSWNPGAEALFGYTSDEMIGKSMLALYPPDQLDKEQEILDRIRHGESVGHFESLRLCKDGTKINVSVMISAIRDNGLNVVGISDITRDITEKKKTEELIWQQANFDALTGLPNRRMVYERLEHEIKNSLRQGKPLAFMIIDLDRFKEVNDSLGHEMGDKLLKEAAQRMVACVRGTDIVGRLGGDEFTIILGGLDDFNSVERIAKSILEELTAPYRLGSDMAYVTASIGITVCPDDAGDANTLIKNADQAMYAAKHQGRNRFHYFTPAMQEAANARMRIINDLHTALHDDQFRVFYQPIVELATGAIHKAEALVRWQHPTLGLVSPADFIPIAEETGMIAEIGCWVFHQAATQAVLWRTIHHAEFQISVNRSAMQFKSDSGTHSPWLDHMKAVGLPGQSIAVEITESLLMETLNGISQQLLEYRDNGMQVSLDDFGTGYSSLAYLQKFDIDFLKIDRSFMHNLASDSNDLALCEAMIVMAHKLGIKVIAEGIETQSQCDFLKKIGCDYGQGYFFSKPLSVEDFEKLLAASTHVGMAK